jgi:hypothetical protein
MDKQVMLAEAAERVMIDKIATLIDESDFPDVTADMTYPLKGTMIDNIKVMRGQLADEDLFNNIVASGTLLPFLERWIKDMNNAFIEQMTDKFYEEIKRRDSSIKKNDCRSFVAQMLPVLFSMS